MNDNVRRRLAWRKIVSIANKNFKTSFSINPLRNSLNFQAEKKVKNKNQKGLLILLTKGYFFQKNLLKNNKTQKL
jgi:hypothetical protein